jgi:hypothetical protein
MEGESTAEKGNRMAARPFAVSNHRDAAIDDHENRSRADDCWMLNG